MRHTLACVAANIKDSEKILHVDNKIQTLSENVEKRERMYKDKLPSTWTVSGSMAMACYVASEAYPAHQMEVLYVSLPIFLGTFYLCQRVGRWENYEESVKNKQKFEQNLKKD